MSSEEERDQRLREIRRTTPEWWRDVYIDEYIGDDEPELTQAKEDFDAMIQQIERRVLAQQPCYGVWSNHGECGEGYHCSTCQARAAQTQETSG